MSRLDKMTTEAQNPASTHLDQFTAAQIVQLIVREDAGIVEAIQRQQETIAEAIERIAQRLRAGGRLIYLGAGTSGRLGVLDAAECPPTFNSNPDQVVGIIAGGRTALVQAIEGAEDHAELGVEDLIQHQLSDADVLVGIATSGRTPYVIGGLQYARQVGAFAIGLTCNEGSDLAAVCDLLICPVVGPEVLSGSTRMKAGTATKLVLNMLTTGAMVLLGKTYGNLMVDLRATNSKLMERTKRIVSQLTGLEPAEAQAVLEQCDGELKTAIVAQRRRLSPDQARACLERCQGHLRSALEIAWEE